MRCTRHIIVCEGESEWTYLQRLQSFLDQQPLEKGAFESPLRLIAPLRAIAKSGKFGTLKSHYNATRKDNRNGSIEIWTDFDLYHRNDNRCAERYAKKPHGIPDFLFSIHNFEDFIALHLDVAQFKEWLEFGEQGHFKQPLYSAEYITEFQKICPGYRKAKVSVDFISWDSLRNLKRNKTYQPSSNPSALQGVKSFADFLIREIEQAFPGSLS